MRTMWLASAALLAALTLTGCGGGSVKEYTVKSNQAAGLDLARTLLTGYAQGKPVGSEIMGFEQIVNDAKKQDAEKAAILDAGLKDIQGLMNTPAAIPAKAKEILAKLG